MINKGFSVKLADPGIIDKIIQTGKNITRAELEHRGLGKELT